MWALTCYLPLPGGAGTCWAWSVALRPPSWISPYVSPNKFPPYLPGGAGTCWAWSVPQLPSWISPMWALPCFLLTWWSWNMLSLERGATAAILDFTLCEPYHASSSPGEAGTCWAWTVLRPPSWISPFVSPTMLPPHLVKLEHAELRACHGRHLGNHRQVVDHEGHLVFL